MNILTGKQQRLFWDSVREWVLRFRVVDWTIRAFTEDRDETDPDCMANCMSLPDNRVARITLYKEWHEGAAEDESISEIACHEVLHVVLSPLMQLAGDRFTTEKQLEDAEHEVIRQILSMVFKKGATSD